MQNRSLRDTVLLSGWLFADLLLGLMMIFMVSIPGAQPKPVIVPTLTVSPASLDPASPNCTGGTSAPQCTVTVGETPASLGNVSWTASSDISNTINFSPAKGTLLPGKIMIVTISALPCQNGSFIFSGSRGAAPVTITWQCKAPPPPEVRLDFNYQEFTLNVDYNGLLNNSPSAINDVKNQVKSQGILQGRSVGIAIVYGGAPGVGNIPEAQTISQKIYSILGDLGKENFAFQRASYYTELYSLGTSLNIVKVDVYLFKK